jgi:hypothetical protein
MWTFGIKEGWSFMDNRKPAELPEFDLTYLDPLPNKYTDFYNDHFPLRNSSIYALNYADARFFLKSPCPNEVTVGQDGWLYPGKDELDFLIGVQPISDSIVTELIKELNERYEFCKANGTEYRLVVVPSKAALYPEHLPANIHLDPKSMPMNRLLSRSVNECNTPILYLLDSLKKHKGEKQLFLSTDTHWNQYGSYFGYRAIMNWMYPEMSQQAIHKLDTLAEKNKVVVGNLSKILGLGNYWNDTLPTIEFHNESYVHTSAVGLYPCDSSWFSYCSEYSLTWQNQDSTLPGLLVIRDSFTNDLLKKLLCSHFGRTTFIWDYWQHKLNKEIIQKEKPNVVIDIMNEGFLLKLIKYPNKNETGGVNFLPLID